MINSILLIGILIVLVISMILYVQYHANYSLEKFVNENDRFINCSASECNPTGQLAVCRDGTEVIAYVNNSGDIGKYGDVCINELNDKTNGNTCDDNKFSTICGNQVSSNNYNKDKYYLKQEYCELSNDESQTNANFINPDNINQCDKDKPDTLKGINCKNTHAGMYEEHGDKVYVPCKDNSGTIKGFKVFSCNSK